MQRCVVATPFFLFIPLTNYPLVCAGACLCCPACMYARAALVRVYVGVCTHMGAWLCTQACVDFFFLLLSFSKKCESWLFEGFSVRPNRTRSRRRYHPFFFLVKRKYIIDKQKDSQRQEEKDIKKQQKICLVIDGAWERVCVHICWIHVRQCTGACICPKCVLMSLCVCMFLHMFVCPVTRRCTGGSRSRHSRKTVRR